MLHPVRLEEACWPLAIYTDSVGLPAPMKAIHSQTLIIHCDNPVCFSWLGISPCIRQLIHLWWKKLVGLCAKVGKITHTHLCWSIPISTPDNPLLYLKPTHSGNKPANIFYFCSNHSLYLILLLGNIQYLFWLLCVMMIKMTLNKI